ncbi:MAG: beta-ketoacyl synthase chain length factor [Hyphomonadaceae bacterium]|nr:beta-ketoacyl synthase chain length factor [Hyphomonadaceae bacterium]
MGRSLGLGVANWAAIVSAETAEEFGAAAPETIIPASQRRRLPAFSRTVLRTALPLLTDKPRCPVILTSPHGDLHSTVTLLTDIAKREVLSPSLFGLSVHNAPTGALSLCLEQPGDQVSIAGDAATLSAGLTEAYARLATAEAHSVVLIYAEERMPETYAAFELTLSNDEASMETPIGPGRDGALAVVHALNRGARRLHWSLPRADAWAA